MYKHQYQWGKVSFTASSYYSVNYEMDSDAQGFFLRINFQLQSKGNKIGIIIECLGKTQSVYVFPPDGRANLH